MVLLTLASFGLGEFLIYNSPWYLLPLAWAWTGTAFTGVSRLGLPASAPGGLALIDSAAVVAARQRNTAWPLEPMAS